MSIARGPKIPIEKVLLSQGRITADQLKQALAMQQNSPEKLERLLVEMGFITERDMMAAYAQHLNLPLFDPGTTPVDPSVAKVLPEKLAQQYNLAPIRRNGGKLMVAMQDPTNVFAIDDLRMLTGLEIEPLLASMDDITAARNGGGSSAAAAVSTDAMATPVGKGAPTGKIEPGGDGKPANRLSFLQRRKPNETAPVDPNDINSMVNAIRRPDQAEGKAESDDAVEVADEAPIIRMVNVIIQNAVKEGASDIHVEPDRKNVRVRYRIDGVLYEVMTLPKFAHAPLISRLKIMAEMNIAERRVPQDGRIHIRHNGNDYDMRVSVLPTVPGEKCVMRILDQSSVLIGLGRLGFMPEMLAELESLVELPNGMVLTTGPTGTGKTTTLYAVLNKINTVEKNIITVEDPVEYQLAGVNQVGVNRKAGMTFPVAMRSFLRQDPDIIMVGEIRDLETAEIAVQAALTGHLVLSTLHTNSAPASVVRLTDMGLEPFLISASVIGIIAQRLGRKLCESCKEPIAIPVEAMLRLGVKEEELHGSTFFKPVGCPACTQRGYKGRVGIFELLSVNDEIAELIVRRAPLSELTQAAISHGMTTLLRDGLSKAKAGVTTIEEVLRVVRGH